jgi:hypothetical protein
MRKEAVYYRKTDIKKFEDFKDGDCICEVCNGWGYFYDCFDNKVSQCYHCKGIGKLDWVTNAMGRQNVEIWYASAGTNRGKITPPVNNLADAKKIARERGLKC